MATCDELKGRQRDICRGHDDAGHPVLDPARRRAYLDLWIRTGVLSGEPPSTELRAIRPAAAACRHREETLRRVQCRPCQGALRATIHACTIHGECTERPGIYSRGTSGRLVHACRFCEDYEEDALAMPTFDTFDRVYCVNLDRCTDRWDRFAAALPADWPFAPVERFAAVDGRRVTPPPWWTVGRGAWGCYQSHLAMIERCLADDVASVLILEDDAIFPADFSLRVEEFLRHLPGDWGMLYLGGQHLQARRHPPRKINELVYRPHNVNRTHAYALRGRTMQAVYEHLKRPDWHKGHHIDHHLGRFHQRQFGGRSDHPVYCPRDWLVGQDAGRSNISGRRRPARFWPAAESLAAGHEAAAATPFVAVIGLHSSGSSCLAGVLHHLGVHLGNQLGGHWGGDAGKDDPARSCGYEAVGLAGPLERHIPLAGTIINRPARLNRSLTGWIAEKRREAAAKGTLAGGKHPLLCRLGDRLRMDCGEHLRVLFIDRPLGESIQSLRRRCPDRGPAALEAHQRWLAEGRDELRAAVPAERQLAVRYCDLLRDPAAVIARIVGWLGISPSEAQVARATTSVKPSMQHVGRWRIDEATREPYEEGSSGPQSYSSDHPSGRPAAVVRRPRFETERIASEVTIGFTAFRRPRCVRRLVRSIRDRYPRTRILVADNGDQPADLSAFRGVETLSLPFDSGISASRNAMVARVETPYVWLLDDDLVFTAETDCRPLLDVLDGDAGIGVVGGAWHDERPGRRGVWSDWALDLSMTGRVLRGRRTRQPDRWTEAGTHHYGSDTCQNFALFRTEVFRGSNACRWDEALKIQEHWDYYWRLKLGGRWRVAVCPSVRCRHARVVTPQYAEFRGRTDLFNRLVRSKWGLRKVRLASLIETPPRTTRTARCSGGPTRSLIIRGAASSASQDRSPSDGLREPA